MISAEGSSSANLSSDKAGTAGQGNLSGRSPNCAWIVATGKCRTDTRTEVIATATINPGALGATRRNITISAMVPMPISAEGREKLARAAHNASILAMNSAGTVVICRPSKSFNWLAAMMTAMPMVKPLITGSGTSRISLPACR